VFVSPPSAYRTSASRSCFPINYGVVDEIARRVWLNGGRVSPCVAATSRGRDPSRRFSATRP